MLNLIADIAGFTVGALLDPLVWGIGLAAALRLRPRWFPVVGLVGAAGLALILSALEPAELRAHPAPLHGHVARALACFIACWAAYGVVRAIRARRAREA